MTSIFIHYPQETFPSTSVQTCSRRASSLQTLTAVKTHDRLKTMMVQEQYLLDHLWNGHALEGRKAQDHARAWRKAENYVKAHATEIAFSIDPKPSNIRSVRSETQQCHNCKEQSQCPEPSSPRKFRNNSVTSNLQYSPQSSPRQQRQKQQQWPRSKWQQSPPRQLGQAQQQSRQPRQVQQQLRSNLRCFLYDILPRNAW